MKGKGAQWDDFKNKQAKNITLNELIFSLKGLQLWAVSGRQFAYNKM